MFDITSSKLIILGIVALLVVGPKELPALLRTIGKYVGMIRRQAAEFRSQFDEAMRESEIADIKKDVENLGRDAENAIRDAETSVNTEINSVEHDVKSAMEPATPEVVPYDPLNGLGSSNGHDTLVAPAPQPAPILPPPVVATSDASPAVKTGT